MSPQHFILGAAAMILAALGMWLMLPRGRKGGRLLGGGLSALSLVAFILLGKSLGSISADLVFGTTAAVAVAAAAMAVTFRSPVYCAIWFALSLLATAGLFMLQGAQFLGVATIVVYAGAILVTFLFVLMLAQPGGHAYYDRVSWEGLLASVTGAVLVGILTMTVVRVWQPPRDERVLAALAADPEKTITAAMIQRARVLPNPAGTTKIELELAPGTAPQITAPLIAKLKGLLTANPELTGPNGQLEVVLLIRSTAPAPRHVNDKETRAGNILHPEHVAKLGAVLFSQHLIAVEVAGTLLLIALVGAVAILSHDRSQRTSPQPRDNVPIGHAAPLLRSPRNASENVIGANAAATPLLATTREPAVSSTGAPRHG